LGPPTKETERAVGWQKNKEVASSLQGGDRGGTVKEKEAEKGEIQYLNFQIERGGEDFQVSKPGMLEDRRGVE